MEFIRENLPKVSKAIAGALATALVAWLSRHDVVVDSETVNNIVAFVVSGILGFVVVWLAPKNKEA